MKDIAFCSVAVTSKSYGDAYIQQQARLKESILKAYPEAPLFFHTDSYPKNSKDWLSSLYGFKPHAVQEALDAGYKKIVWFDTAMILMDRIDFIGGLVTKYGVIAVKDDSQLSGCTSDNALKFFCVDRDYLKGKNLVGGSFYYFDFEDELCISIFESWKWAEERGIFGSQDEESAGKLQGMRADETAMALSLYGWDSGPVTYDQIGYNGEVMKKEHFK